MKEIFTLILAAVLSACAITNNPEPKVIKAECSNTELDKILQNELNRLLANEQINAAKLKCELDRFSAGDRGLIYYTGLDNGGYAFASADVVLLDDSGKEIKSFKQEAEIKSGSYKVDEIIQKLAKNIILNLKEK